MPDASLQDYLTVLRRRRGVVIACVLVSVGMALAISLIQTPRYRASAQLLLRRTPSQEILIGGGAQAGSGGSAVRELNNEVRVIESRAVRDAVRDRYDGPLNVAAVEGSALSSESTDVLGVSMVSSDADEAASLVNLYVDTYISERRSRQVENVLATADDIRSRLENLQVEIAEVSQPLDDINAQIDNAAPGSPERAQLEDQRDAIMSQVQPQLSPLQSRESSFRSQLEQLEATQDLLSAGGVEVLAPAEVPKVPVSPNTVANLVVGAMVGLLGGTALAFARDYLDDSVGSKDQAEEVTQVPTLGLIPRSATPTSTIDLITVNSPASPAAEAYRSLRTSVKFLSLDSSVRTMLVTSATASEGKTSTAANLAVVLSQRGDRVLLVDADLRRPRLHKLFGAPQSPGLTTALVGDVSPFSAIYGVEEVPGLFVMAPGSTPPNPAELLDSSRSRELFSTLAQSYDTVIIDAPPVLPVTDAQILATMSDAVLLVVAYRETSARGLSRTVELLGHVEAPLVGNILNLMPTNEGYAELKYRYEGYRARRGQRRRGLRREAEVDASAAPLHLGERNAVATAVQSSAASGEGDDGGSPLHASDHSDRL